jgi:hypothetical protein
METDFFCDIDQIFVCHRIDETKQKNVTGSTEVNGRLYNAWLNIPTLPGLSHQSGLVRQCGDEQNTIKE